MNSQLPVEYSEPPAKPSMATCAGPSGAGRDSEAGGLALSENAARQEATILVRGEAIHDQESRQGPKDSAQTPKDSAQTPKDSAHPKDSAQTPKDSAQTPKDSAQGPKDSVHEGKEKPLRKEVSKAKLAMQNRLPILDDDGDVGALKEHIVIRDGTADIAFTGKLIASAAPASAPTDHWQEYRIYETNGGKHVFSKVTRSVLAAEEDTHQAEIFDPSPSSVPAKLLRGARDLTRSEPLTWMDAAAAFFGYDPLAKALYRKLGGQFEERIG